jgi:hypothetical protein
MTQKRNLKARIKFQILKKVPRKMQEIKKATMSSLLLDLSKENLITIRARRLLMD